MKNISIRDSKDIGLKYDVISCSEYHDPFIGFPWDEDDYSNII